MHLIEREREREWTGPHQALQSSNRNSQISHKLMSRRSKTVIAHSIFFLLLEDYSCKSYIIFSVAHDIIDTLTLEQKCVAVPVLPSSTYSNLFPGRLVICLMKLNWREWFGCRFCMRFFRYSGIVVYNFQNVTEGCSFKNRFWSNGSPFHARFRIQEVYLEMLKQTLDCATLWLIDNLTTT